MTITFNLETHRLWGCRNPDYWPSGIWWRKKASRMWVILAESIKMLCWKWGRCPLLQEGQNVEDGWLIWLIPKLTKHYEDLCDMFYFVSKNFISVQKSNLYTVRYCSYLSELIMRTECSRNMSSVLINI